MKILFLGTPEFAVASANAILQSENHSLIGIVCQPDRDMDRKGNVIFSPMKQFAQQNGIECFQWEKISRDGVDTIKELAPDIMITAAYGQILSQEIIDIPKFGIINVHGSLLPKYRGASPIQTALINGDKETGITIMKTEAGLDTGDIISTEKVVINEDETCGELMARMSEIGAKLLIKTLDKIEAGTAEYIPQIQVDASITTKISKKQAFINFEKTAKELKSQILGMNPEPIAYTSLNGVTMNVYRARVAPETFSTSLPCGTVIAPTSVKAGLFVQCNRSVLEILELQFAGGKKMSSKDAINGNKIKLGDKFSAGNSI